MPTSRVDEAGLADTVGGAGARVFVATDDAPVLVDVEEASGPVPLPYGWKNLPVTSGARAIKPGRIAAPSSGFLRALGGATTPIVRCTSPGSLDVDEGC